jgi:prolipoprotein diacylglyceryltransferase
VPPTQILIDVDPTIFQSGPILLTATGLATGLALIIALLIGGAGLRKRGIAESALYDIALRAVPFGLLGGRVFHVADNWTYYGVHPLTMVEPGGFSLDGAILVGGLVAVRLLRKRGMSVGLFFDALAPSFLAAMVVGSFGSLVSGDLLGRPTEAFLAVKYINANSFDQRGLFVYPVAAYLIIWFGFGALIYRFLARRETPNGVRAGFALFWLGFGQVWQEFFRSAPIDWFGLSQGQILGLIVAVAAIAGIIRQTVRHKACTQPERAAQLTR